MRFGMLLVITGLVSNIVFAMPTHAAVISSFPDADIESAPYRIDLTPGSSLTFDNNANSFEGSIGVETAGTTEVFSQFGTPAYFQPFSTSGFPSDQLGAFEAYSSAVSIPFSVTLGTIGFEYTEADGTHYGLASLGGTEVNSYFLNTTPNQDISLAAPSTISAAPEPSSWILMIAGVGCAGLALRRRQVNRAASLGAGLALPA